MDEQNSYEGFSPSTYGAVAPALPAPSMIAPVGPVPVMLRPLSTGEVLDRTFALYRRRFWLFAAIGILPAATVTATTAARIIYVSLTHRVDTISPTAGPEAIARALNTTLSMQVYFLPATVFFVIAYGLSHAAAVHAVGHLTRGLEATAAEAYRATRGRWLRWTGIAFRLFWSVLWPVLPVAMLIGIALAVPGVNRNTIVLGALALVSVFLLPAALVLGVINLLRNALGMPAGVEEDLRVNAAMRRSKVLVAGRKGRIFLSLLLVYALQTVAGGLQLPFVLIAATTRGAEHIVLQAAQLIISFVATALVTPIASIALTLLYVDERVRREGYDIELMMQRGFLPAQDAPAAMPDSRDPLA